MSRRTAPIIIGALGLLGFCVVSVMWTVRTFEIDAANLTEATPPLQAALWIGSILVIAGSVVWLIVFRRRAPAA
jgi:formate hydrogenlyase subunit 3/multisubunit Na+/H+ antiporter MnhD subunit